MAIKKYELPKEKKIIPPKDGWKNSTYYKVRVCFRDTNPAHDYLFYSGFLNGVDNGPGGYNGLLSTTFDELYTIDDIYYMEVISELGTMEDL